MEITLDQIRGCGVVDPAIAGELLTTFTATANLPDPGQRWRTVARDVLGPSLPFALHLLLYRETFADWDYRRGPPPAWTPSQEQIEATHIFRMMGELGMQSYDDLYAWSIDRAAQFWDLMVRTLRIPFDREYRTVIDASQGAGVVRWLVDGRLNVAESCFLADPDAVAIRFQRDGEGMMQEWSYGQLRALANRVANGLVESGIGAGEAVAVDMPMTPEAVAIYLGIIKAGGVVVSIADSFVADEITTRLRLGRAKTVFTQDLILREGKTLPLYERVVAAGAPAAIVLPAQGPQTPLPLRATDRHWTDFLSTAEQFQALSRDPDDHANILFSSGTTGDPKAIPWSHTTPIKCAVDGYLHHDIKPGEVVAWPTNLGWMMGPWLIFASLVNRATIGLYGGSPGSSGFGRFVQEAGVNVLGVVPSLVRAWRSSDCMKGFDWNRIKAFSSTGECSDPDDILYLMHLGGYKPVIEYCGGTEIGGGYIAGTMVQPASPGTFTTPALGSAFEILDEQGGPTANGELFLRPPAMGLSGELMNEDHHKVYYEGVPQPEGGILRRHGDRFEALSGGFFRARGRVDDTMNLGGIKVGAAEIEESLSRLSWVREAAAIAVSPADGGPSLLVVYAVVEPALVPEAPLAAQFQKAVADNLNPLFRVHDVVLVDALPRTASNKVMRRVLRDGYSRAADSHSDGV